MVGRTMHFLLSKSGCYTLEDLIKPPIRSFFLHLCGFPLYYILHQINHSVEPCTRHFCFEACGLIQRLFVHVDLLTY
jgi:hypothetical protein